MKLLKGTPENVRKRLLGRKLIFEQEIGKIIEVSRECTTIDIYRPRKYRDFYFVDVLWESGGKNQINFEVGLKNGYITLLPNSLDYFLQNAQ